MRRRSIQVEALANGRVDSPTDKEIPTHRVPVSAVTRESIADTLIADRVYTLDEICAGPYKSPCAAIGLK
ncbi:hypothetical protein ACWDU3_31395 [Streptomyces olivaceus]